MNEPILGANDPLLVFIGPSGAGKTTIVHELVKRGIIELTPTWTDRPKRPEETAREHVFVTGAEFTRLEQAGFFVDEPMTFFGLPYRYGLPAIKQPANGKVPAFMGRVIMVPRLDLVYPGRTIYQIESDKAIVQQRLSVRGDTAGLGTRFTDYDRETEAGRRVAKRIFVNNSQLGPLIEKITAAITEDFKN